MWRQRTLRWFDELKEEPKIEPSYFTETKIMGFIESAAAIVTRKLGENDLLAWL